MEGSSESNSGVAAAVDSHGDGGGVEPRGSEERAGSHPNLAMPIHGFISSFLNDLEDDNTEQIEHFKYKQDLKRHFTVTSIIGLGVTLMGVPFGISSTLWISLVNGSNVTILYGWIVVGFFSFCVGLSLCEIISKYPTSGGVYHFSAILSNDKYSLISSWFTGWLLLIGNWTYTISIMFSGSQFILSVFGLKNAYYKQDVLEVLGVYFILLTVCGFINFRFSKYLEKINKLCIVWSIYTVLVIDVLLIFFSKKTNSIKDILTNFDNSRSGWPSALSFMVGLQSSSFTLTGYGMIFSMTDEVKNPERNMPKGALSSILLSTVMGIIFILPILTILPELTVILDKTPEIMPIDMVFKTSTESYLISFLLVLLLIGTVFFQSIGSLTTASRTTYAFARDGGFPYKDYWVTVDSVDDSTVPKNALFLSMVVCGVLSLLSLVSASAFNSFMGASVISLALANGIPILCLILNKRQKIRGALFKLRGFGWVVNIVSLAWIAFLFVVLCLPPVIRNLTWFSMNYSLLVILLFVAFASIGYRMWGVGSFQGPQIDNDYFELSNLNPDETAEDASIFEIDNENENEIENDDENDPAGYDDFTSMHKTTNTTGDHLAQEQSIDQEVPISENNADQNEVIFDSEAFHADTDHNDHKNTT